jgi:hypothetical protein
MSALPTTLFKFPQSFFSSYVRLTLGPGLVSAALIIFLWSTTGVRCARRLRGAVDQYAGSQACTHLNGSHGGRDSVI